MRRAFTALASAALATLAFAGVALAAPGTKPDLELTLTPDEPTAGTAVLIQAYVHFGTKPYQGAQVQFQISGPGMSTVTVNAKPGETGFYRGQFTPQATGDFTITTSVDGTVVSPKPYHVQVSGATLPDWTKLGAAGLALAAALGLGAIFFRRRIASGRPVTVTN